MNASRFFHSPVSAGEFCCQTAGDRGNVAIEDEHFFTPWRKKRLPWLPKKSSYPLDAAQKPYYCESKIRRRSRPATTAPLGLVPVRSARALPPTTQETSAHASLMT
jgi:hypothetical protein